MATTREESMIGKQLSVVEGSRSEESIRTLLRMIRVAQVRLPGVVVKWGRYLSTRSTAPEVLEQLFVAALDVHDMDLAAEYEAALIKRFPTGSRMARLKGMKFEAEGKWSEATKIYQDLVDENKANAFAQKRLVCVADGQGGNDDDMALATAMGLYLSNFQSDKAAWQRLAELHSKHHEHDRAIFCYEELTLFEPAAPHWHCRLGELYCGTNDLYARKHFSQSLELSKVKGVITANARAAFGLLLVCFALGQKDPDDALNTALGLLAASHLKSLYTHHASNDLAATLVAPVVAEKSPPYRTPAKTPAPSQQPLGHLD